MSTIIIFIIGVTLGIAIVMIIGWPMTAMVPFTVLMFFRRILTGRKGF